MKMGSKYGFLYPRTVLVIGIIIFFAECFFIGYNSMHIAAAAADADTDADSDKEGNNLL